MEMQGGLFRQNLSHKWNSCCFLPAPRSLRALARTLLLGTLFIQKSTHLLFHLLSLFPQTSPVGQHFVVTSSEPGGTRPILHHLFNLRFLSSAFITTCIMYLFPHCLFTPAMVWAHFLGSWKLSQNLNLNYMLMSFNSVPHFVNFNQLQYYFEQNYGTWKNEWLWWSRGLTGPGCLVK